MQIKLKRGRPQKNELRAKIRKLAGSFNCQQIADMLGLRSRQTVRYYLSTGELDGSLDKEKTKI